MKRDHIHTVTLTVLGAYTTLVQVMENVAKESKKRTKWNRECNIALISEMNAPEDCRIPLHLVKYGGLSTFWKSIAEAMTTYHNLFPGSTFPSYKVCQDQFAELMKEHKSHHDNHQFKSGTTEDFNELSSGLDELMMNQDKMDDESTVNDEKKKTVEAASLVEEQHLKTNRITPKIKKVDFTPTVRKLTHQ